jgi:hypothetical protein
MSITARTAIRDPLADHLLTPQNAALAVIDYQPSQFAVVRSMEPDLLLKNIASTFSWVALAGELQRDWARAETVEGLRQIVLTERLLQE